MSSIPPATPAAPHAADRIRVAAIAEFAERGFSKTTVRAIAKAAGVSPGLVIHHYGSKDQLRAACDEYVFTAITEIKRDNADASPLIVAELLGDGPMRAYADYLVKSMLDPSEQGQRFFDHYVETLEHVIDEGFEGYTLRKMADRRVQAVAIATLGLAPMLLENRVKNSLGVGNLRESMTLMIPYLADMYRHGFIESVPQGQTEQTEQTPTEGT